MTFEDGQKRDFYKDTGDSKLTNKMGYFYAPYRKDLLIKWEVM